MPHTLTWMDRLRIERVVWTLDQRLFDLPRKSRIAKRREVRENLYSAGMDIGVGHALQNLGNTRQLATEYRAAEYGDAARPAWIAAAMFLFAGQLILTSFFAEAAASFGSGIKAAHPDATGTFTWSGISYLQDTVTYTFINGRSSSVGGGWTPMAWIILIIATVFVGRLWRLWHMLQRAHRSDSARRPEVGLSGPI
jgi:hypothetical protein